MAKDTKNGDGELLEQFRVFRLTQSTVIRSALIFSHKSLVEKIVRRFLNSDEPFEDLVSEGTLGLIKAVDTYNPDRGVKFETFAAYKINGEIRHYLRDLGKLVREPGNHAALRYRVLKMQEQLTMRYGREPSPAEMADALDLDEALIVDVLASGYVFKPDSLDEPVSGDEDEAATLIDGVADPIAAYPSVDTTLVVRQAIRRLRPLQRSVVYYFFYKELTKTDIATLLGISINSVSYLVKKALQNLTKILSATGYEHLSWNSNGRGPQNNRLADTPQQPLFIAESNVPNNARLSNNNAINHQTPEHFLFAQLVWFLEDNPDGLRSFGDMCHRLAHLAETVAANYDYFKLFFEVMMNGQKTT